MSSVTRPRKKRALELMEVTGTPSSAGRLSSSQFVLQHQLDSLQAELEHERSLRALDQKRAQQDKQRMEKQIEFALEEANEAKAMLDQHQEQTEAITKQLREAKNKTLEELRECQYQLEERVGHEPSSSLWEKKCAVLEEQLAAKEREVVNSANELKQIQSEMEVDQKAHREQVEGISDTRNPPATIEDAPPTVMMELNKVRVRLAEVERENRELDRSCNELKKRVVVLLKEKQDSSSSVKQLPLVETNLQEMTQKYEVAAIENRNWRDFSKSLECVLKPRGLNSGSVQDPPQVTSIVRFLEVAEKGIAEKEDEAGKLKDTISQMKTLSGPMEAKVRDLETQVMEGKRKLQNVEILVVTKENEVKAASNRRQIVEREVESLRSLIKTFDDLPISNKASQGFDSSSQTLQVSLDTAKEKVALLESERTRLSSDLKRATDSNLEQSKEIERVKEKFLKLRTALMEERAKVEAAEQRANDADLLAGKGSFNPETTRVLHLKDTPLTEALREEIKVLQRQLDAKSDRPQKVAVDPEKLNKRLKENFKEQISVFREAVYLMTGYKVDMLPGTDRPTFRVRSMFSEQESDQLLLKWPKTEEVSSLDILNTDHAKVLTQSPSYDYMTKFHSLPAFLASVQLTLFEKQTMIM